MHSNNELYFIYSCDLRGHILIQLPILQTYSSKYLNLLLNLKTILKIVKRSQDL